MGKSEIVVDGTTYRREEDTLDTWFSSAAPYIITDYLDTGKLAKYYPNTPSWRQQAIFGLRVADDYEGLVSIIKSRSRYLHGLVLDEKGYQDEQKQGQCYQS